MQYAARTDQGRRDNNEDAYRILEEEKMLIVADGVGGNRSGEIASGLAVREAERYVDEHPLGAVSNDGMKDYFQDLAQQVNQAVLQKARSGSMFRGMATTLVAACLKGTTLNVVNIGDSRAYLYHDGSLEQLTVDHTYVNTLLQAGVITEAQAKVHENKNMITRAMGADQSVESDFFQRTVSPGDIVLLCTDGLYDNLGNDRIAAEVTCGRTMDETCRELMHLASVSGSNDNITLICAEILEEDIHE